METCRRPSLVIGLGFVGLALFEGGFSFLSGRLAAYTAEGITRRLRDFLFDHIQRLSFSYHATTPTGDLIERVTSDVDALRRFFSEQAIGMGRIILLFVINFIAILNLNAELALVSVVVIPFILLVSLWFFKTGDQALRRLPGTGSGALHHPAGKPDRCARGQGLCPPGIRKGQVREGQLEQVPERQISAFHALACSGRSRILCLASRCCSALSMRAMMAINGEITVGTYIAYVGLVVWLIWPIRNLGRIIVSASTGHGLLWPPDGNRQAGA